MFWKKKKGQTPTITFRIREDLEDAFPRPQKARKMLPEWFKKLSPSMNGQHKNAAGTVKRCIPVLDACTHGYIIPAWCDMHISVTNVEQRDDDGNIVGMEPHISINCPNDFGLGQMIGGHGWEQVGNDCPLKWYPLGKVLLKFTNPWVIETAPGWSVLFKSPPNHYNNIRLVEGIVDCDTYKRQVNFPFFWDGCNMGEFEIKKGDPLVHVIPFKREETTEAYGTWDHETMCKMDKTHETHFFNKYRQLWWHKRKNP